MAAAPIPVEDLPKVIAVFPLDAAILLPRARLPLNIFEPRYLNMLDDAMNGDRIIGMVQTVGGDPARPELARVGCAGKVTSFAETPDGRYLITLGGICRFALGAELNAPTPYRQVRVDYAAFAGDLEPPSESELDRDPFFAALQAYLHRRGMDIEWTAARAATTDSLITSLSMALPFDPTEKQALVEAVTLEERVRVLTALLQIDESRPGDEGGPPRARQ